MVRTSRESSLSVNFRMPASLLKGIDELAARNQHERTAEINGACRHWMEIGGVAASDKTVHDEIERLEKQIAALTAAVENANAQIEAMKEEIKTLSGAFSDERRLLLSIIEGNKTVVTHLLSAAHAAE